jgi:GNAT superfamily N-acetyltransferase
MEIKEVDDKKLKKEICTNILEVLPEWFGIPEATQEYIDKSCLLPFLAVFDGSEPLGFVSIKENNAYTAEIFVMGVLPDYHKQGIGRTLVNEALNLAKAKGFEFLQVKTLDSSHPDVRYAGTRKFYLSMGFRPLECIPEIWGEENPCLIMIQYIGNNHKLHSI